MSSHWDKRSWFSNLGPAQVRGDVLWESAKSFVLSVETPAFRFPAAAWAPGCSPSLELLGNLSPCPTPQLPARHPIPMGCTCILTAQCGHCAHGFPFLLEGVCVIYCCTMMDGTRMSKLVLEHYFFSPECL